MLHSAVVFLALCFCLHLQWIYGAGAAAIGLNYYGGGDPGSDSSPAEDLVSSWRSRGIAKVRLHDTDSGVLRALGSPHGGDGSIEVVVGMRNEEIVRVGSSPASARVWVARNVLLYTPKTKIVAIAVGREVLTSEDEALVRSLVPAMRNIHSALGEVGLEKQIKVSSPQSALVLSGYFPPSAASFNAGFEMAALLEFLASSDSFFMLNFYPHDQRQAGTNLPFDYALSSPAVESRDPQTGLHYSDLFDALVDAVYVAMASMGYRDLDVVVTDAEWSRAEELGKAGVGASFGQYLIGHLSKGQGTPSKPGVEIDAYVADLPTRKVARAFTARRLMMGPHLETNPGKEPRRKLADKSWCVAKSDAKTDDLQTALDWACGPGGADCQPIQNGQRCYLPNDMVDHASYAFNSYFQKLNWASGSCDFGGLAYITKTDPSNPSCLYSSNTSGNGTPSTPTGTIIPTSLSERLKSDRRLFAVTAVIFIFLSGRTTLFASML